MNGSHHKSQSHRHEEGRRELGTNNVAPLQIITKIKYYCSFVGYFFYKFESRMYAYTFSINNYHSSIL